VYYGEQLWSQREWRHRTCPRCQSNTSKRRGSVAELIAAGCWGVLRTVAAWSRHGMACNQQCTLMQRRENCRTLAITDVSHRRHAMLAVTKSGRVLRGSLAAKAPFPAGTTGSPGRSPKAERLYCSCILAETFPCRFNTLTTFVQFYYFDCGLSSKHIYSPKWHSISASSN